MSRSKTVISRDHTFWYAGELYRCYRHGPYHSGDNVWGVYRDEDGRDIENVFDSLSDIRYYVDEARRMQWPLFEEN
jgi:hypothetical protein